MVVEIRFAGTDVKVRRFGTGKPERWVVVPAGQSDDKITGFSHDELRQLGEGVWEIPDDGPSGGSPR